MTEIYRNRVKPGISDERLLRPITEWAKWPWRYVEHHVGFQRCIVDGDGRLMVAAVTPGAGPLMAAGPALLMALWRVANLTKPGSMAHEVAVRAIEGHLEREGMQLDAPPVWKVPRREPLRIVGVAT